MSLYLELSQKNQNCPAMEWVAVEDNECPSIHLFLVLFNQIILTKLTVSSKSAVE